MNYWSIHPCLLVRQVDQFGGLKARNSPPPVNLMWPLASLPGESQSLLG
jgi:hypothetical protein